MKRIILTFLSLLVVINMYAQEIEKLGETRDIKYKVKVVNVSPQGILVDELREQMHIINGGSAGTWIYNLFSNTILWEGNYPIENGEIRKKLGAYKISWLNDSVFIDEGKNEIVNLLYMLSSGISFILKKDSGYIVYFVYEGGTPGAVDTSGKIYSNTEALAYLKEYDPEKYTESLSRAEELELKSDFERGNVLIWGKTYYSTVKNMLDFWTKKEDKYLYLDTAAIVQYDAQGNGYQTYFAVSDNYSKIAIVSPNGERLIPPIKIHDSSEILKQKYEENDFMGVSTSWYVGYGGNIYYYIAGEEYTEVFRIRRTWGNPDMYAMAINGYTEDNYGKYVTETLATMSKADLRLLRNTIFALYGVHFKSEDLSAHFAKEVWYTDEGKTSGEVELPPHRQKLVEMIQELERK